MSSAPKAAAPPAIVLETIKYSLAHMLEELKSERSTGSFSMEKLDQNEIGKLFKTKVPRRVKLKK